MAGFDARFRYTSKSLTPAAVAANTTAEQDFTNIPRVDAEDMGVGVQKPTAQAGLGIVGARVSAAGQISLTFSNNTGSSITPTADQTYDFLISKKQP